MAGSLLVVRRAGRPPRDRTCGQPPRAGAAEDNPGVARPPPAGCDGKMPDKPMITLPLLRLGRLQLDPGLRALQPGSAASGLVVTATVPVPDSSADRQYAWDVAWADAAREAGQLGADQRTVRALPSGAGKALMSGTRVVV